MERTSGCYLEKGPTRVPFVRRSGTFVLMVRRRTSLATHGVFVTEGLDVAMETLTQGASDRSMHIPIEIAEDRLAESLPVPERPSEEAVARHQLTHMPYAAWCHDCVAGRAVEDAHRRLFQEPPATPVIAADYCFLGLTDKPEAERREGDPDSLTVLVMIDGISG